MFVSVASATAGAHTDCLVLASVAQWPEIPPLVSRGQIKPRFVVLKHQVLFLEFFSAFGC